ncbi:MAG: septum formation initiator family protein [Candidatus Sungbacteria bacterium]|nr:septum formation initiator family protein [Candidatus Sungbacteria bacterium]
MKWIRDSMLFHVFLLIVAAAVAYASFYMVKQVVALYRESAANQKKIAELTRKKDELEQYLKRLQTPGAIEQQARERLNLKLPGEQVVVVLAEKASSTQARVEQIGKGFREWLAGWLRKIK